jgi:hypothetical protein
MFVESYIFDAMVRGRAQVAWGKREMGFSGNTEPYLICRWGMDKLIPFEKIRSRSWLYHTENTSVTMLASEKFWVSAAAGAIVGTA